METIIIPEKVYLCFIFKEYDNKSTQMLVGAFYNKEAAEKHLDGTKNSIVQEVTVSKEDFKI